MIIGGGIIPNEDIPKLKKAGILTGHTSHWNNRVDREECKACKQAWAEEKYNIEA